MKTFFKGILYTIISWVALVLLICLAVIAIPFAIVILPVGAFMYAKNPESIIKDINEL